MSRLDEILDGIQVSYLREGGVVGKKKAKQQIKALMLDLIGKDYVTTTYGYDKQTLKVANSIKAELRKRIEEL